MMALSITALLSVFYCNEIQVPSIASLNCIYDRMIDHCASTSIFWNTQNNSLNPTLFLYPLATYLIHNMQSSIARKSGYLP